VTWLLEAASGDEDYVYESFMETVDALAMGAGTYAHIEHLDPLPFGGRPVFVFTHRRRRPRPGVTFWQQSPPAALERWSSMGLDRVYVDGGALISEFLAHALIDDLVRTKVPVLLGSGVPLCLGQDAAAARGCRQLAERFGQPLLLPSAERAIVSDLQCPATMLFAAGGEAQCAAGGVWPQDDDALTEQGRAQVRHFVAQVADRRVAAVYSSAMRRAAESAELAASALGLPVVVLDDLQELSAGDSEPVSCDDQGARHVSHGRVQAGLDIGWPPAQDGRLVVERFGEAIGAIADTYRGETVLVFTDAAVMSLAVRRLSVNVGDHLAGAPNLPHCAVAEVEVDSDGWRLVSWPGPSEQA
jgi:probable phosphoglycerate mutase